MGKFKLEDIVTLNSPLIRTGQRKFILRVVEVDIHENGIEFFYGLVLVSEGFQTFKVGRKIALPVKGYELYEDPDLLDVFFAALTKLEQRL